MLENKLPTNPWLDVSP